MGKKIFDPKGPPLVLISFARNIYILQLINSQLHQHLQHNQLEDDFKLLKEETKILEHEQDNTVVYLLPQFCRILYTQNRILRFANIIQNSVISCVPRGTDIFAKIYQFSSKKRLILPKMPKFLHAPKYNCLSEKNISLKFQMG